MKKTLLLVIATFGLLVAAQAQTYNFTNASASGRFGPTQSQTDAAYTATNLFGAVTVMNQGIQEWIVPTTGTYRITAIGACGGEGQGAFNPGLPGTGATIEGDFALTAGTTIYIVVAQKGVYADNGSGGGGGSFVYTGAPGGGGLMIAAGGGGGHGHGASPATAALGGGGGATTAQVDGLQGAGNGGNSGLGLGGLMGVGCNFDGAGSGGAGWTANGQTATCGISTGGSFSTFVGGDGGLDGLTGGFGGGGGSDGNGSPGGGGGGYTGGGGGNTYNNTSWGAGAGAGSFNSGLNPINTAGISGAPSGFMHGSVTIDFLCTPLAGITLDNASLPDLTDPCSVSPTAPTATTNCGTIAGIPNITFPMTGSGVITWTFDDGVNLATQTQNVTISDTQNPIPDAASLNGASGQCSVSALPVPTATDCGGAIQGVPDVTFPLTTPGLTVITWSYTDGSGNTATQTQNVNINDVAAPNPDVVSLSDLMECSGFTPPTPTATDNCEGATSATPDVTFPITAGGLTVVTWTYIDGSGNTSSQTQNITITVVNTTVTSASATITADATGATYQWIDCDNGNAPIVGETNISYTASVTGSYAVEVTENGCTDMSACTFIDFTGLEDINSNNFKLYPNPNNGQFVIDFPNTQDYTVTVFDLTGKLLLSKSNVSNSKNTIDGSQLKPGTYQIRISDSNTSIVKSAVVL